MPHTKPEAKASEIFLNVSTATHLCDARHSPPTVSWLSHASLPAAAAASFQAPRFSPATGQTAAGASSVSATVRSADGVLLQKADRPSQGLLQ